MWRRSGIRTTRGRVGLLLSSCLLAAAVLAGTPVGTAAASISDSVVGAAAAPRVFEPGGDPALATAVLHYELIRPTNVTVEILDFALKRVRLLQASTAQAVGSYDLPWDGRVSPTGGLVQDGGYRFRLTVSDGLGTFFTDRPVTKAPDAIFPANPGAITVAIDAGHGGPDPGAIRPPVAEKGPNLDIALRLRAFLVGAGVHVVMTRTGDTRVDRAGVDWTRDGKVTYRDELASRIEVANAARADVFVVVHNNGTPPGVGGTETWYDSTRTFAAANRQLATLVQRQLLANLRAQHFAGWVPKDRGIHQAPFYVLRRYHKGFLDRPSEMPGILGESLGMGNKVELKLLRTPRATEAIAEGYYEGLVGFFAGRTWGARYDLLAGPGVSAPGDSPATTRIRVTNTSPRAWADGAVALTLSALKAVPWYDGSSAGGVRLATVPLPALASGESTDVTVPFTVPGYASAVTTNHRTILKADLLAGTQRLEVAGVPPLQQWLTITSPGPTPPPTASPSPSTTPSPSPTGTASPSPSPDLVTTPSPAATPPPAPTPSPADSSSVAPSGPASSPSGTGSSAPDASPDAASSSPAAPRPSASPPPGSSDTPAPSG